MVLREIRSRHQLRLEPSNPVGNQGNLCWQESCRESLELGQPPVDEVRVSCPFAVPSAVLGLTGVIWTWKTLKTPQAAQGWAGMGGVPPPEGSEGPGERSPKPGREPSSPLAASFPSRVPEMAPSLPQMLPPELPPLPSSVHTSGCSSKHQATCAPPLAGSTLAAYHRQ